MTPQEFLDKADWEGGILDGIFGYGLSETDLDEQSGEFYEAVKELASLRDRVEKLQDIMMRYDR